MTTESASPRPHRSLYRSVDVFIERLIGADFRLIYGMGIPILLLCGVIIALAEYPKVWLVAILVILELGTLFFIVRGLMEMMDSEDSSHEARYPLR